MKHTSTQFRLNIRGDPYLGEKRDKPPHPTAK
jgi:hypothetical protein